MITPKNDNILNNEDVTRKKFLKKILNIIIIFSLILIILLFFYPTSNFIIWTILIIPIIWLSIFKYLDWFIINGKRKNIDFYFVLIPLILSCTNFLNYHIIYESKEIYLLTITSLLTIIFLFFLIFFIKPIIKFKNKIIKYFAILIYIICIFIHSNNLIIFINCNFDNKIPEHFISKIIDKKKSHSWKSYSYHIIISPWWQQKEKSEISIKWWLYYQINIWDNININLRKWRLNIPWYTIEK